MSPLFHFCSNVALRNEVATIAAAALAPARFSKLLSADQ
jgi:hypothetical protein